MRLEKRWYDFWVRNPGANREAILAVREHLFQLYNEPGREYHNLGHIEFCLGELDRVRNLAQNPMVVEAAIWFHDTIYITQRKDNEKRSARFARQKIKRMGGSDYFIEVVERAILSTTHAFAVEGKYPDDQLMCDIDLAGLGQDWSVVEAHNVAIRKEYSWVSIKKYKSARAAIMQSFLNRGTIYYLPEFRERYEAKARRNIKRTIAELK